MPLRTIGLPDAKLLWTVPERQAAALVWTARYGALVSSSYDSTLRQ